MTTTTTAAAAPRIQYFPTGTAGTGTQQLAYEPTDSQAPTKLQSTKPAHPAAGENGAALHSSTQHHTTQKRWTRRKQRMHTAACSPTQLIRPSRASTSNQANDTRQPPESNLFNPLEMTVPGNRDHGQVGNLCSLRHHAQDSSSLDHQLHKSSNTALPGMPPSPNSHHVSCVSCIKKGSGELSIETSLLNNQSKATCRNIKNYVHTSKHSIPEVQ